MAGVMGLEEKAQAAPHCFAVLGVADHSVQGANSFIPQVFIEQKPGTGLLGDRGIIHKPTVRSNGSGSDNRSFIRPPNHF